MQQTWNKYFVLTNFIFTMRISSTTYLVLFATLVVLQGVICEVVVGRRLLQEHPRPYTKVVDQVPAEFIRQRLVGIVSRRRQPPRRPPSPHRSPTHNYIAKPSPPPPCWPTLIAIFSQSPSSVPPPHHWLFLFCIVSLTGSI